MSAEKRPRKPRRVVQPGPPGADPNPAEPGGPLAAEDDPKRWGDAPRRGDSENDERLRRDKPPHWG